MSFAASCILLSLITVTDGDTFRIGSERIRIMGIDAPETYFAKCPREKEIGLQAKENLKALLSLGCVTIKRKRKDRYRRTLAHVYLDGIDISTLAINQGWAREYHGKKRKGWC